VGPIRLEAGRATRAYERRPSASPSLRDARRRRYGAEVKRNAKGSLRSARPPRLHGPLDDVNDAFHARYGDAKASAEIEAPVLIVLSRALVLCRGERERTLDLTVRDFHVVKSAAHAPIALYSSLCDGVARPLTSTARGALVRLHGFVVASFESLDVKDPVVANDVRDVLSRSASFVEKVLAKGLVSRRSLSAFARRNRAVLRRLTMHASRIQLDSLHGAVEEMLAALSRAERRALQVVVSGDHQARIRSLAMQYFQRRFGERPGLEVRVAYGERVTTVEEALALVGARRHDAAVADAFFGDAKHLQQDVLGDAAATILAKAALGKLRR